MLTFFSFLKAISAVFLYKVTDISSTMVTNLDLTIEVVKQRLSVYPTLSKLPRPLCPTSAHAQRVHHAWPVAVKNRATSLSSIEQGPLQCQSEDRMISVHAGNAHVITRLLCTASDLAICRGSTNASHKFAHLVDQCIAVIEQQAGSTQR